VRLSISKFVRMDGAMNFESLMETQERYLKLMETVPTQAYMSAAAGSLVLSLLLRLIGKKDAAVFVGQWPTMILLTGLAYKVLKPSKEDAYADGEAAVEQATKLITSSHG
jgi:hypothetical protein